jgi:histidinol dehydrogenase
MKILQNTTQEERKQLAIRPEHNQEDLFQIVSNVFAEVQSKGDEAINYFTQKFDKVSVNEIEVKKSDWYAQAETISSDLKSAIELALRNIEKFHKSQVLSNDNPQLIEVQQGVTCWQESRPIEKIGIYIPGGSAPLFSTVLMLAVPARIAGCEEIILCTPPNKQGTIHPAILFAAKISGVTKVMAVGGIQAIAGLTFGTATIPQVYKIFGPGNQYVTAAKQFAFSKGIAIDLPAGPSELMVVADETSVPEFVASDLLSQAEHGADSQVVCVVNSVQLAERIEEAVNQQVNVLPRKEIALLALQNSFCVVLNNPEEAIEFINLYAPEHLIIAHKQDDYFIRRIKNAGSVFLGNYTPESAGDYASGTNHTLPTNGFARMYSGVNMDAFVKKITFQRITEQGLRNIGGAIEILAQNEELQAHKNAVTIRLNKMRS